MTSIQYKTVLFGFKNVLTKRADSEFLDNFQIYAYSVYVY